MTSESQSMDTLRFRSGQVVVVLMCLLLLALAVCSCEVPAPWAAARHMPWPTGEGRADFLDDLGPVENSVVSLKFYRSGNIQVGSCERGVGCGSNICVSPNMDKLVEQGDRFTDWGEVEQRIELWVDGSLRTIDSGYDGIVRSCIIKPPTPAPLNFEDSACYAVLGGPYSFCSRVPLEPGRHKVVFRFRQTSGKIKEYCWSFTISKH